MLFSEHEPPTATWIASRRKNNCTIILFMFIVQQKYIDKIGKISIGIRSLYPSLGLYSSSRIV